MVGLRTFLQTFTYKCHYFLGTFSSHMCSNFFVLCQKFPPFLIWSFTFDMSLVCYNKRANNWFPFFCSYLKDSCTFSIWFSFFCFQDKYFGKQGLYRAHVNPKAHVSTTLKTYQQYTLLKAYLGETFFWGISPRPNDIIKFEFTPPVVLEK